jgi:hypothetical protein
MRKFLIIFGMLCVYFTANSQVISVVERKSHANINVYLTNNRYEADATVMVTNRIYKADKNLGYWYFDKNDKWHYDCAYNIYFVNRWYEADIIIHITDNPYKIRYGRKYIKLFK